MDLYRQEILDHVRNPQNWGLLPRHDIRGSEINTSCGDEITIDLKINHEIKNQKSPSTSSGSRVGSRENLKNTNKNSKVLNHNNLITQSIIEVAGFEGSGCIVMLASADMLAGHLEGKTVHDIMAMPDNVVLQFFGGALTPSRQTCALLPLLALRKEIAKKSSKKQPRSLPHHEIS